MITKEIKASDFYKEISEVYTLKDNVSVTAYITENNHKCFAFILARDINTYNINVDKDYMFIINDECKQAKRAEFEAVINSLNDMLPDEAFERCERYALDEEIQAILNLPEDDNDFGNVGGLRC